VVIALTHEKRGILTIHHLTPVSRGGDKRKAKNMLAIWWNRHRSWHHVFGNSSLLEIICTLEEVQIYTSNNEFFLKIQNAAERKTGKEWRQMRHETATMLHRQIGCNLVSRVILVLLFEKNRWHNVFNGGSIDHAIALCQRIQKWKGRLNGEFRF